MEAHRRNEEVTGSFIIIYRRTCNLSPLRGDMEPPRTVDASALTYFARGTISGRASAVDHIVNRPSPHVRTSLFTRTTTDGRSILLTEYY